MFGWLKKRLIRDQRRMAYMTGLALAGLDGNAQGRYRMANGDKSIADVPNGVSDEIDEIRMMANVVKMLEGSMRREDANGDDYYEPLGGAFAEELNQIHLWTRRAYKALPISHHRSYEQAFTPAGGWDLRGL